MKASNKSSLITGISLLVIAALFSISLILQPLDFGVSGPGHNNIFYLLGNMLYSVYGFSSILIPAFLLIAGLSCFASQWTARKTMRLLTALVPFFTCVVTENICRSILALGQSAFSGVKIAIAVITGIMLVIIEWLGTGIIADKLNRKISTPSHYRHTLGRVSIPKKDDEMPSVFDEALSKVAPDSNDETDVNNHTSDAAAPEEESAPAQPLLTQEEYAALTSPEEDLGWDLPPAPEKLPPEYDEDFDKENSEIDENDPALEFPPKDEPEETAATAATVPAENEEPTPLEPVDSVEAIFDGDGDSDPAFDIGFEDEISDEESEVFSEDEEITTEKKTPDSLNEAFSDYEVIEEDVDEPEVEVKETPYSTARYIDTVVENPNFPHGITIHEDDEESVEEAKAAPVQVEKPKYPSKIQIQSTPERDDDFEDNYIEDDTLPFPEFGEEDSENYNELERPAYHEEPVPVYEEEEVEIEVEPEPEPVAAQPVSAPVMHEAPVSTQRTEAHPDPRQEPQTSNKASVSSAAFSVFSDMENEIREEQAALAPAAVEPEPVINEPAETTVSVPRPSQPAAPAAKPTEPAKPAEVDFEGNVISHNSKSGTNLESASGATNLTADELTDFFNAQQSENTPKTTEIAANPPKIGNRATKKGPYVIPSDLLIAYKDDEYWVIDDATKQSALNLKQTLSEFNIEAQITGIKKGPVVTMFEILPAPGVKLSKIVALQDNIALSLAAQSVRIVAPIPGKQAVGIEVPNKHRSVVGFREIIEMDLPEWQKMAVPVVLGKDILGKAQLIDLVKTPHMLIAGATGSGKSVCVNSLILSILYKRSFQDVKLILVDPKVVELKLYNSIPHLLTPVITEPKKALQALQWCLCEMERRYALLDGMGVRDISNYNIKIKEQNICTEKLPYIVVIIDEFADLMATSGKELETIVARLTAMSRAVGIHLVLATQRPSVNVITGLIKANIPTRIAFMVASRTDSNIIIDTVGAEKLLGRGDMLYASAVDPAPIRIQGTFVTDQEVEDVVNAVKEYGEPDYIDEEIFVEDEEDEARDLFGEPMDDDDPLYDQALEIVVQSGKASASYIQRRLKIGYNRAARLVEEMEERGIVGPANGSKPREVIHIP